MRRMSLLPLVMALLLATACSKTVMENQPAADQQPEPVVQAEPELQAPEPEPEPQVVDVDPNGREDFLNEHVYFDFDSTLLNPEAQSLLQIKAQWLQDNPDVISVLIEGHCDERGTEAYNLALGSRRAEVVKNYLTDIGVGGNCSLKTQSYGEEKPLALENDEAAWAKNRRACFVIN